MMKKSISHRICEWIANHLPNFGEHTIYDANGKPYLRRIYLTPRRKDSKNAWWPGVFLHHFYQSDNDRNPHNHPWTRSASLILAGGYFEWRYYPDSGNWERFLYLSGEANCLDKNTFHRVELIDKENGAWSLFMAFGRDGSWGFWDIDKGKFVPWNEHIESEEGLEND